MFYINKMQLRVFYLLLYGIWIASTIYTMINNGFLNGLLILLFGTALVSCIYFMQRFFINMIHAENKALKQKTKKE